jgi:hypothetical protein
LGGANGQANKGAKQLPSIQRQDLYLERLKELDAYQLQNLGGYTPIYPPMRKNKTTGNLEVDEQKLNYYKVFLDHAKKFMMDFKVSNNDTVAKPDPSKFKSPKKPEKTAPKQAQSTRMPVSNTSVIGSQSHLDSAIVLKGNINSISPLTMALNDEDAQQDNPQECMIHVDSRGGNQATRHEKRHSQTSLPTESLEEAKTLEVTSHSYLTPA